MKTTICDRSNSGSTLKRIKESIVYLGRHNILLSEKIKRLQLLNNLPEEELLAIKKKKLQEVMLHALKASPFYKSQLSGFKKEIINQDYSSLPVFDKYDIRKYEKTIATVPLQFLKPAQTSGTSGTPLTIHRSPGSIFSENAYLWMFKISHGLNIGDPVVSLRGNLDRYTTHYFNRSENVLYLSSFRLSKQNINIYANLINEFKPKGLLAYPSSAYHLAMLLNESDIKARIPLLFTSSETLYDFQREKIEAALEGRIYDYYGNAERTIALGECDHGNYHELPLYSNNEFTEHGVITTSLTNSAFPLIRYFVDDAFKMESGKCACGKSYEITKVEGRADDVVRCTDGTVVAGAGLSLSFRGIDGIENAQIIQKDISKIQVNVVPRNNFTKTEESLLLNQLRNRLSDHLNIEINRIGEKEIIRSPTGKFKLIVSSL